MSAQALFAASQTLLSNGQLLEARASLEEALALDPQYCDARFNLGVTYQASGQHDQALVHYQAAFDTAVELEQPTDAYIGNLLNAKMRSCDWAGLQALQADIEARTLAGEIVCPPFQILSFSGSLAVQAQAARLWVNRTENTQTALPCTWDGKRRVRVVYVSADFRLHPVAYLTAGLFEAHDRARLEVYAFNTGPVTDDPLQTRIRAAAEHFVDVQDWTDDALVRYAKDQGIDIAIELTGLTQGGRLGVFATRMAPIQAHFLGYLATTQMTNMDYIIADAVTIPLSLEAHYSERVIRMPRCFQVSDGERVLAAQGLQRADFGLPEDKVVLCSFCNTYKITEPMFALWMQILQRTDNTVLMLYADNALTQNNLRNAALAAGVDASRIYFGERVSLDKYLARLALCDLFLDTAPYNAGTTANDALWIDLPILTMVGESFISRMAASLLSALGLYELITHTPEDYVARAVQLVSTPSKLQTLRYSIAEAKISSGLFDPKQFALELEDKFVELVRDASSQNLRGEVERLTDQGAFDCSSNNFTAAQDCFETALALAPNHARAHYQLGMLHLTLGHLQQGWAHYNYRLQMAPLQQVIAASAVPLWTGEQPLEGSRFLMWAEQGLGDIIQFSRYAPLLKNRGVAHLTLACDPQLHGVLQSLGGVDSLVGVSDVQVDYHCPLLSLPMAFGTELGSIPTTERYLHSASARQAHWTRYLQEKWGNTSPSGLRIGLAWNGKTQRSLSAEQLFKHLPLEHHYVCVQKDVNPADDAAFAAHPNILRVDTQLQDWTDTAALLDGLDLLISVDTSVAHMSGALGRPTWLLLSKFVDWRWLLDRTDSPWYQSMRLWRHTEGDAWDTLLARVGHQLQQSTPLSFLHLTP